MPFISSIIKPFPASKADRRRLAAAQGALRIVTGGGSPARPIDKQKAHVEAQNEAAKG